MRSSHLIHAALLLGVCLAWTVDASPMFRNFLKPKPQNVVTYQGQTLNMQGYRNLDGGKKSRQEMAQDYHLKAQLWNQQAALQPPKTRLGRKMLSAARDNERGANFLTQADAHYANKNYVAGFWKEARGRHYYQRADQKNVAVLKKFGPQNLQQGPMQQGLMQQGPMQGAPQGNPPPYTPPGTVP